MSEPHPPFRADHVGSFLRPPAWKEARAKFDAGEIDAAALAEVEDREIIRVVSKQEELGLRLATDGEFRRATWHNDFFAALDGCEPHIGEGVQFHGVTSTSKRFRVTGKIRFPADHPAIGHFVFLRDRARGVAKATVPSPTVAHFRRGHDGVREAYPDLDDFFADLTSAYVDVVAAFHAAGCRYLQFDDTSWAHLGAEAERQMVRDRGEDPDALAESYALMLDAILATRPPGMAITTHLCHGNFQSSWSSAGDYEAIAETLLGRLDYDGYFIEYDTERAGGFEPLRFLPKGDKRVVLGLITSKAGALEDADGVKRRIEQAASFAPLDQLCLSPQCGFASTEEGNLLSEDEQWAKLAHVVKIAGEVWGDD